MYFTNHSGVITGQCKKVISKANKNEIKCFDFGSIKRALRPHLRTIKAGQISIYRFASPIGKHDDFIAGLICCCVFKLHKPSKNFSMKSSYAKDLNSFNTQSNLSICILIFNEPVQAYKMLQMVHEN